MIKGNKIFVLHDHGANGHYRGLAAACEEESLQVIFREFGILKSLYTSILNRNGSQFLKQFKNLLFLMSLIFTRDRIIVLGIAPFDFRLIGLMSLLSNHHIFLHTSWPYWDKSKFPKQKFAKTKLLQKYWNKFLSDQIKGVFSVTEKAKTELIKHYQLDCPIKVVHHALFNSVNEQSLQEFVSKRLLYVGRMEKEKGIFYLMEIMDRLPEEYSLTFIGDGSLIDKLKKWAISKKNVKVLGQISNKNELQQHYENSDYLILPSQKTISWEELFGMVIIEAMSFGTIPLATNHVGPKEIIEDGTNGFLLNQDLDIVDQILSVLEGEYDFVTIRQNCVETAKAYELKNVQAIWKEMPNFI